MMTLLIETSTERSLVAIFKDEKIVFHHNLPFGHSSSQYLLPAISEGLKQLQMSAKELSQIVVGIGPGSYTGIRVGVVVAKTLSYAHNIPLIGISSLEGFIPEHDGDFAAIIDAKISGVYLLKGKRENGEITFWSEPETCSLDSLSAKLDHGITLVTPNKNRLEPILNEKNPSTFWCWQESYPCPQYILQKGKRRDASDILYLRESVVKS